MKISFIYYKKFSSFIKNDYDILAKHFEVDKVCIRSSKDIPGLAYSIAKSDLTYIWFAGRHALPALLFSKLFGKKSVVVAGGYDLACEPSINYGQFCPGNRAGIYAKWVLENADLVLAVSDFMGRNVLQRVKPKAIKKIYNCIDTSKFVPGDTEKEDRVLMVVSPSKDMNQLIKLKGLDTFIETARLLPEVAFDVVGLYESVEVFWHLYDYVGTVPDNVSFLGPKTHDDLVSLYQRAKVYCQLSLTESFGVALVEAMACGCVPVVTYRGALPEIVPNPYLRVEYDEHIRPALLIKDILSGVITYPSRSIASKFSIKIREDLLIDTLKEVSR